MKGIKHFMVLVGIVFWVKSSFGQTKISNSQFKTLATNTDAVILDVRTPEEFAEGHIPEAINCPLSTFAATSEILDKEKKVVVYCNSGGRSYGAYIKLMKLGYKNIAQAIFADWNEAGLPVATEPL